MQLVAYGAQDIYLTGNPQITFFKVVYRRHTNFSMECIQQTVNGSATLGTSSSGTVTVSRNGDLVGRVYVSTETAGVTSGDELVSDVTLEIGGQQIDKQTKEWMQVWNELSTPDSKADGLKVMTGNVGISGSTGPNEVQLPLQFYFCRNPGLALPLIALQYHEVKLKFNWGTSAAAGAAAVCTVWADYIYLDTEERRRFAQVSHEYLIEQVQFQTEGAAALKYKLNFNHPVKELVWTNGAANITTQNAKLTLNGHDRFASRNKEYFQLRQPYDHHTAVPRQNLPQQVNDTVTLTATTQETTPADVDANTKCTITSSGMTGTILFRNGTDGDIVEVGDILSIDNVSTAANGGVVLITRKTSSTATVDAATGRQFNFSVLSASTAGDAAMTVPVDTETVAIRRIRVVANNTSARTSKLGNSVNVYSFALKPEEHQPSGTCNFSRIDTAHLEFDSSATVAAIYAVNYNVLRVMSGMGGLAYSN